MRFLYYSLLRIGLMAAVFVICLLLKIGLVFSGIFAVLIGFAAAYLAFPRLHAQAGEDLARFFRRRPRREKASEARRREETALEDAYVDERLREEGREL